MKMVITKHSKRCKLQKTKSGFIRRFSICFTSSSFTFKPSYTPSVAFRLIYVHHHHHHHFFSNAVKRAQPWQYANEADICFWIALRLWNFIDHSSQLMTTNDVYYKTVTAKKNKNRVFRFRKFEVYTAVFIPPLFRQYRYLAHLHAPTVGIDRPTLFFSG